MSKSKAQYIRRTGCFETTLCCSNAHLPRAAFAILLLVLALSLALLGCPITTAQLTSEADDQESSEPADEDGTSDTGVAGGLTYPVVDTGQAYCYNDFQAVSGPAIGESFYGQDAQYDSIQPSYTTSSDGLTVYDNNTGLTWVRTTDTNGDGTIDADDKFTWYQLQSYPDTLNAANYGGYSDWRLPSIKELYSLVDFSGSDPSSGESGCIPFIDNDHFTFAYGDTSAGERTIDSQYASSTLYVSTTMGGQQTLFGVNFADGRIKGYGLGYSGSGKTFFVMCCRGNTSYGENQFVNNNDGTLSDEATGLMWQQADSGVGMEWEEALAYAENLELAGYSDWRLPNAKELQSIVDYGRSPDASGSPAIDPLFTCTAITNEAGQTDYPFYWTGTTHVNTSPSPGSHGAYISFGRAMGYVQGQWMDVHGAGAQRSDPKYDDGTDWSFGHGPQGDAVRIYNFIRCVRGGEVSRKSQGPVLDTKALGAGSAGTMMGQGRPSLRGPAPGTPGGSFQEHFVARLDQNRDRAVSRDEFDGPPDHFDILDQDGNGHITEGEAPTGPPPGGPPTKGNERSAGGCF